MRVFLADGRTGTFKMVSPFHRTVRTPLGLISRILTLCSLYFYTGSSKQRFKLHCAFFLALGFTCTFIGSLAGFDSVTIFGLSCFLGLVYGRIYPKRRRQYCDDFLKTGLVRLDDEVAP